MEPSSGYFERHAEQAFIAKSLAMVLFIIVAKDFLRGLFQFVMILAPIVFYYYIRYQLRTSERTLIEIFKEHFTFIPVMRTDEERRAEKVPWVTYLLIAINLIIFYAIELPMDPEYLGNNLVFLPREPDFWNVPISALTSMFLHSGNGHLWGNMTFLWVVGCAVERRIDSGSFLFLYLFTGLMGGILFVLVEYLAHGNAGHLLGASGAIAGIMGIYAVRCYFKSMIFPVPILGIFSLILPISLKVRLNSLVIIGLFFYSDLSGGLAQLAGHASNIGHWVHLGGMISGMIAAGVVLNLGDKAIEERHLELGIKAVESFAPTSEGEKSLSIALQQNPDCGEALLALARLKTRFAAIDEGRDLYLRAMKQLVTEQPQLALVGFHEFVRKFPTSMEPQLLDRLANAAARLKERAVAVRCYTMLADLPTATAQVRERALFQSGKILEELGEFDLAHERFAQLLQEFPEADVAPKLRLKLAAQDVAVTPVEAPAKRERIIPVASQSPAATDSKSCPVCSAPMSRRRATSGDSSGALFWVCNSYPLCRQVSAAHESTGWELERTSMT